MTVAVTVAVMRDKDRSGQTPGSGVHKSSFLILGTLLGPHWNPELDVPYVFG